MCNHDKNSNAISFGLGTLLGAGAGFFLSTKKGRKMVKQAWKQVSPYIDDAVDTAKDEFEEVKGKAKIKANEFKAEAQDMAHDLRIKADDLREKAQEFRTKAEDEIDRTVSQIRDVADEKLPPSFKKPIKRTFFKGV